MEAGQIGRESDVVVEDLNGTSDTSFGSGWDTVFGFLQFGFSFAFDRPVGIAALRHMTLRGVGAFRLTTGLRSVAAICLGVVRDLPGAIVGFCLEAATAAENPWRRASFPRRCVNGAWVLKCSWELPSLILAIVL